jgi:F-type H+-transporting ATPase subunit b
MTDIGFPQLNVATYPSQIFWLAVAFVLLYTLMSKVALPRVTDVLERRRTQRAGNLDKAAALNDEAEKVRAVYEKSLAEAQQKAADTMNTAHQEITEKVSAEQSRFAENARKRMLAAEQNIVKAKADALASLADIAADIAADMAQKIADVQVNKADAKKAVQSVMQKGS